LTLIRCLLAPSGQIDTWKSRGDFIAKKAEWADLSEFMDDSVAVKQEG